MGNVECARSKDVDILCQPAIWKCCQDRVRGNVHIANGTRSAVGCELWKGELEALIPKRVALRDLSLELELC